MLNFPFPPALVFPPDNHSKGRLCCLCAVCAMPLYSYFVTAVMVSQYSSKPGQSCTNHYNRSDSSMFQALYACCCTCWQRLECATTRLHLCMAYFHVLDILQDFELQRTDIAIAPSEDKDGHCQAVKMPMLCPQCKTSAAMDGS